MNKVLRKIVTSATIVAVTSTLIFANSSAIIAKATTTEEEVIDNKLEVEEASELQDVKANENVVYYKNSNGWAKVYAYVWAGQNQSVKWPGTEMTKVSGDVWSFKIPDGFESGSIIFNDGNSNQTDDLTVNVGKIFEGSAWSDYKGSESGGSESGGSESGGSESGGSESGGSQGGEVVDKKLPVIDKVSVEKNSDGTYTYTVNASGGETGSNLLFYKFFNSNSKG